MSQFDDKLKSFLKENAPIAPEPRSNELDILLRRIENGEEGSGSTTAAKRERERKPWLLFAGSALAAGLAALWMQAQSPFERGPERFAPTMEMTGASSFGEDFFEDDEELPSFGVGEEYLGLIAGRVD